MDLDLLEGIWGIRGTWGNGHDSPKPWAWIPKVLKFHLHILHSKWSHFKVVSLPVLW